MTAWSMVLLRASIRPTTSAAVAYCSPAFQLAQRRSIWLSRASRLVPTLETGDIVVIDSLGSHKAKAVRRALRAVGAKLIFLPPYSPDLNPIEKVFAKLKGALRKAQARTIDGVVEETARALPTVSAKECAGYFRHAGYASI
jgi:transposase